MLILHPDVTHRGALQGGHAQHPRPPPSREGTSPGWGTEPTLGEHSGGRGEAWGGLTLGGGSPEQGTGECEEDREQWELCGHAHCLPAHHRPRDKGKAGPSLTAG